MSQVFTISYISESLIKGDIADIAAQVREITHKASLKNKRQGISGVLLYSGGYFIQVLEGERETVEQLFEVIKQDSRHTKVVVYAKSFATERKFSKWGMGLVNVSESLDPELVDKLPSSKKLADSQIGHQIISVMTRMVTKYEVGGNNLY